MATASPIQLLLERLRTSTDVADKLEALEELLDASGDDPLAVGKGIPQLMDTLRQFNAGALPDPDCGSIILEILENLISTHGEQHSPAMAANTSQLLNSPENVVLLMETSQHADITTACSAVEILQRLHRNSPISLETTLLECRAGMEQLLN